MGNETAAFSVFISYGPPRMLSSFQHSSSFNQPASSTTSTSFWFLNTWISQVSTEHISAIILTEHPDEHPCLKNGQPTHSLPLLQLSQHHPLPDSLRLAHPPP